MEDVFINSPLFGTEGRELARQFGCPFLEASAKLRINVDEAFIALVREIRLVNRVRHSKRSFLISNLRCITDVVLGARGESGCIGKRRCCQQCTGQQGRTAFVCRLLFPLHHCLNPPSLSVRSLSVPPSIFSSSASIFIRPPHCPHRRHTPFISFLPLHASNKKKSTSFK